MQENIFEHGGEGQFILIQPYCKKAQEYDPDINGDFFDFYFGLLQSALSIRAEREEIEDWVVNKEDYSSKSEILIAVTLIESLDSIRTMAMESEEGPHKFTNNFFDKLNKFGKKRGWDKNSLHIQFMKSLGFHVQNPLLQFTKRHTLFPQDYN